MSGTRPLRRVVRCAALALGLALGLRAGRARAEAPESPAVALRREARELAAAERWSEACARLDQASRLDGSLDTLIDLATCEDRAGRTATATARWLEVLRMVRGRDAAREAEARARLRALDARLPSLVVEVAPEWRGRLAVSRDGAPLPEALLGTPVPLDPGAHTVEVVGPVGVRRATSVELAADAVTVVVHAPELTRHATRIDVRAASPTRRARAEPPDAAAPGVDAAAPHPIPAATVGLGVVGALALGAAGLFEWRALASFDDANARCDATGGRVCDSSGAQFLGRAATGLAIVGGAAVAAGAIVWLATPAPQVRVGAQGATIVAVATF